MSNYANKEFAILLIFRLTFANLPIIILSRRQKGAEKLNRYKEFRTAKKMSLVQVAQALNVSVFSLIRWEKGETSPTADKLEKLADLLDTTPNVLLGVAEKATEAAKEVVAK